MSVQDNVKLEVLDWGGSGRPMILLHGGSSTAHEFDTFAPKLTGSYRVYGITRRGCGASSAPEPTDADYTADRLGDDVLAVIGEGGIDPPCLWATPQDPRSLIDELLQTDLPNLERTLRQIDERFKNAPPQPPASTQQARPPMPPIVAAMMRGSQRYTDIRAPARAVYALEAVSGREGSPARVAVEARNQMKRDQAAAFQAGVPLARGVLLENASHDVFQSNESEVLRKMNEFIKSLPKPGDPKN